MKKLMSIFAVVLTVLSVLFMSSCKDEVPSQGEAPSVHFYSDTLKVDLNDTNLPSVICVVKSDAGLKSIKMFEVKSGNQEEQLGNTVTTFYNPHNYSVNVKPYYTDDLRKFKFVVTDVAGRETISEIILSITPLVKQYVFLNQNNEYFNGLQQNDTLSFSGTIDEDVQSLSYSLIKRDGSVISTGHNLPLTGNLFSGSFTVTDLELGKVVITAKNSNDSILSDYAINTHVGYKLYHLVASLSGQQSKNIYTSPGCFFSAEKGQVFDYCGGKDNSEFVDIGFAAYNSYADIYLLKLTSADKFRTLSSCSPNSYTDGAVRDWPTVNPYPVYPSSIAFPDFDKASILTIENEILGTPANVVLAKGFAGTPHSQTVGIYEATIGGATKRVLIAFDRLDAYNDVTKIYSTFWFYAKVQL